MTTETKPDTVERKTSGVQKHGRASRVVNSIFLATAEELTRVGYSGLRIDEVAIKAEVNKTTIYRRWPNKAELVADTIRTLLSNSAVPDTGNLRKDLYDYFSVIVERSHQPLWRGLLITLNSHADPELDALSQELRWIARENRKKIIDRGIDRGELPRGVDAELVVDVVASPILYRTLHLEEAVDLNFIESVLDIVLAGAAANALRAPLKEIEQRHELPI